MTPAEFANAADPRTAWFMSFVNCTADEVKDIPANATTPKGVSKPIEVTSGPERPLKPVESHTAARPSHAEPGDDGSVYDAFRACRDEQQDRRAKRMDRELSKERQAAAWAHENGIRFSIHNGGHHWKFSLNGHVAEWWPSSAKLVIDKQWNNDIHASHWDQVQAEMELAFCR